MRKRIVAIALAASAVAVGAQAPQQLGVRGRANASVSLASAGRLVAAAWTASTPSGAMDVEIAVSRDGGMTFSPPVQVNKKSGSVRAGGEQPPRIALIPKANADPDVVVVWTSSGAVGTQLVFARSSDSARTFSPESPVPGSDAPGNRGWESVAVGPTGRVDVLWLDHRDIAPMSGDMTHHMDHSASASTQADSVARAQLSKLYFATINGGPEDRPRAGSAAGKPLAAGVCYCCKTSVAAGADGAIYATWRHVYAGNIRDIAFAMSKDGGATFSAPVRVSEDKWAIDGCPENGPSVAVGSRNTVHVAWPTFMPTSNGAGTLGLFYAESRNGRTFTPRQTIPSAGVPRHVQLVARGDGSLALAWDEAEGSGRRIAFSRGIRTADGTIAFRRDVLTALAAASYPAIVAVPQGVLVAAATGGDTDSVIRFTIVRDPLAAGKR